MKGFLEMSKIKEVDVIVGLIGCLDEVARRKDEELQQFRMALFLLRMFFLQNKKLNIDEKNKELILSMISDIHKKKRPYLETLNLGDISSDDNNFNEKVVDIAFGWMSLIYKDKWSRKLDIDRVSLYNGALVAGLILVSGNVRGIRHQAENAVALWMECSFDKVKKDYVSFKGDFDFDTIEEFLRIGFSEAVLELCKTNKKRFPNDYKKASEAFEKLYKLCLEESGHLYNFD